MTEAERAERLRKLQERRSSSGGPAPKQPSRTGTTQLLADDPTKQVPRIEERPAAGTRSFDDTRPLAGLPETDRIATSPIFAARQADSIDRPKRARRSHKAEASRIASAGAGIALTFSLMSSMAGADAVAETAADQSTEAPIATATTTDQPPATTPRPSTLSAATPQGPVPVVLAPIQVRTRVVVDNSGGNGGSRGASNGNAPQPGGSATVASPQPAAAPPPPPPETTKSNGSN